MPGRRPSASSIFASPPIPITVPIVSKKSDSITEITIAAAVQKPSELKNPKLNFPTSEKFGDPVRCEKPGHAAEPSVNTPRCFTSFTIVATIVVATIPISSAPLTRRATSALVRNRPKTKSASDQDRKSATIVTGGTGPGCACTTTPALTRPMNAMNSPMPIPIARFRSIGIALRINSRRPVNTKIVIKIPSATITPIACGQVSPSVPTKENATNALSPRPAASAKGYLP